MSDPSREPGREQPDRSTLPSRSEPIQEGLPSRIGSYHVRRRIATGGMGTVYEALQESPRRSVAVKVMKSTMFSEAALNRFGYEAQLLARLRHPCVAQVYEAGTHVEGGARVPFFVMEYIPNAKSITDYAREKRLSIREMLELFARVCEGVHHGHQRGIIHRDLKPSNILIDAEGHPKIIDFGVARATDSDLAIATDQTQVGELIGTLQYMSPEQFDADPSSIDTRSDVYALGLVLYELLSGEPPYSVAGLPIHEIASRIREKEAPLLRKRIPSIDSDLQTIVARALAKDRDLRYQSAFGLREDLRRFLSGEAIAARPPSLRYQLKVLARRNKAWIGAASLAFLAIVAGSVVSVSLYLRAEAQRAEAELQAQRSQKAFDFVGDMLHDIWPREWGTEPTIEDLIETMRERVATDLGDEPEIAAEIHRALGWASLPLEQYDMFEEHCQASLALRRATLGPSDPRTLTSLSDLARAQEIRGQYDDVVESRQMMVEWIRDLPQADPVEIQDARESLAHAFELAGRYVEARDLMLEIVERRREESGLQARETLGSEAYLAWLLLKLDEPDRAHEIARRSYESAVQRYGPHDESAGAARRSLAASYIVRRELDAAAQLFDLPLPNEPGILRAYQGEAALARDGPEILVLWETWCPFSQRVVPGLESIYQRYRGEGLHVIGLTRVTRTSTDERVRNFVHDQQLTFPILRDSGASWNYFEAVGTPYSILLVDGRVVWKGSISTSSTIAGFLAKKLMAAYEEARS